ncbi:hypothetical protein Pst134EA_007621 [Puccinia striiformis f. sp. tritici]|uniref:hypothetical protein n=1 Tax=Puccinia striiformis f. sp. tritici TaxID=168172 RepID=UPI0020073BFA|nr:hypothetical protein Pst134EA_007621 [Puccinia striiformis f. sp. tritici]KAH9470356.1 hypothetical protein Pst134EA_007621 [Puccinia striiformis f. sp. tritici]KAI9624928.1 hypothetical protein KEM48_008650 [Puccinia striiformis f. sp. tritici PST-130]
MQILTALTTVMILYCELAYATPDVVCSSTEQGLCANPGATGFAEPQVIKRGKRYGTQYCAGSDSPACCPTGTITWTSSNHGKYIKVVGLTRKKCRVLKRNDGGDHGDM